MSDFVSAIVIAREHANQDSLPLRFGLHFDSDTQIEIRDVVDLGLDARYSDRHHYEGYLSVPHDADHQPMWGHFVVGYRQRGNFYALVTAWRNKNQDDEFYLSNTLKNLREEGFLSPQKLLEMHPCYLNGEIGTSGSLMAFLAKHLAADRIDAAKRSEERAREEAEISLRELHKAQKQAEAAKNDAARAKEVALEAIQHVDELEIKVVKAEQGEQAALAQLAEAQARLKQLDAKPQPENGLSGVTTSQPAVAVTKSWRSKTGSSYKNQGIEAEIQDVTRSGQSKIKLEYIGHDGTPKVVEDFGYQGFVEPVFKYLISRKGKRGIFLLTQKPGGVVQLASDTMMLPAYRGLWT